MKKYTVILLRPDYLCDGDYGQNTYVAFVEANDFSSAVGFAQKQVFDADSTDGMDPESRDDYALVLMFEGHHNPVLYGWQL